MLATVDTSTTGWVVGYTIGIIVVLVVVALVVPILVLAHSIGKEAALINDSLTESVHNTCLLYTSPSPRDRTRSRMPSSA